MRNDKGPPEDWNQQWKWDREHILQHLEEYADKHDKLCKEVQKNTIDIAVMWTKVAWIAAAVSAGVRLLPAILKLLQTSPK